MSFFTRPRLQSILAAALGAVVFVLLGLPLPLLLGPLAGCLVFALAGVRLQDMGVISTAMRTILGVAIGSAITPAMVHELPGYGPSLLLIPIVILACGGIGYPLFRRVYGYDKPTAYYSAMPGGLQDMLVFGEEAGGNVRSMSLIHATRVLVIVSAAPFLLTMLYDIDLSGAPGAAARDVPLVQLGLMVLAGFAGWKIAAKVGLFGASILGPMIAAALLSLTGFLTTRPPAEAIWVAQFFIGLSIGSKYTGITSAELRRDVGAGIIFSIALAVLSLAIIELVFLISPAATLDIILAFLPGGQAEMVVLALVAGADVAFVVAHHLLRIILVILLAPIVQKWLP